MQRLQCLRLALGMELVRNNVRREIRMIRPTFALLAYSIWATIGWVHGHVERAGNRKPTLFLFWVYRYQENTAATSRAQEGHSHGW